MTTNTHIAAQAWRCFHCDEVFRDQDAAAEHFGRSEYQQPGCQIDLTEYRRMEELSRRYCEEDTDLHRAVHAAQADGDEKARRAEEAGYARGLADAKKHPEELGLMALPALDAQGEASRPDILEKLTYHQLERDDLTLDDCLSFLANGWRKVHGRSDRQMVMQILSLLASTPLPHAVGKPLSNAQFVKCIETAGFKTWDCRMWSLKREIEAAHGIATKETGT